MDVLKVVDIVPIVDKLGPISIELSPSAAVLVITLVWIVLRR